MRIWLILLTALTISSCATKKERAVKHLNKAIGLDATVLKHVIVPIIIDTTIIVNKKIVIDTTFTIPEKHTGKIVSAIDFQKSIVELDSANKKVVLLENELLKLTLKRTKDGLIDIQAVLKESKHLFKDTISHIDTIPFYLETKAPSVAPVTEVIYKKGYLYYMGILLHFIIIGLIIYFVLRWKS